MVSEMKELVDENGLFKVKCTVSIDLTTEEIKEAMDFIRSEKNTDKELSQYKYLSDEALTTIILDKRRSEMYDVLDRLCEKTNN